MGKIYNAYGLNIVEFEDLSHLPPDAVFNAKVYNEILPNKSK